MNKHKKCWSNYTSIEQLIEIDRKETLNKQFKVANSLFQGVLLIVYVVVSVFITMSL